MTNPTVRAAQTTEMCYCLTVWSLDPKIKVWAGLVPSEGCEGFTPLPASGRLSGPLQTAIFCVFTASSLCVCLCVQTSPFYIDSSHTGLGPSLVTSSYVDHLQRPYFHIRSHPQVLRVRTAASFGDTIQPLAWGKVQEAAGPPVGGELSPVPPRMSLLCYGYFPSPTNPAPSASLPPPLPHASINLHLVLRAGNLTSNPSCYFDFYIRTWQDGHIYFPVLRWADSSGHGARESTNDSEPFSLPREDTASFYILLHLAKHSPEHSDGEPGGMVSLVSSGGGAFWNGIEQTLKTSQG